MTDTEICIAVMTAGPEGARPRVYEQLTFDGGTFRLDDSSIGGETAIALFRDSITNYLIGEGYHSFEWGYDSDTELVTLDLYDSQHAGRTQLHALHSALTSIQHH